MKSAVVITSGAAVALCCLGLIVFIVSTPSGTGRDQNHRDRRSDADNRQRVYLEGNETNVYAAWPYTNAFGIPRIIHVSWKVKNFWNSRNPLFLNGIKNLKEQNPEYTVQVSDDDEVDEYIQSHLSRQDWLLIKDKHIVEKTDLWRLLKIYYEGGMYCDIDRFANIPLREIILGGDRCILPIHRWIDFSQDIMIAEKGMPHVKRAIELNLDRRKEGCKDVLSLGPITYFHAITETYANKQLPRYLERQQFSMLQQLIERIPGFKCFPEHPPKTLLFDPARGGWKKGNNGSKADFYQECDTTHWTKDKTTAGKKTYGR